MVIARRDFHKWTIPKKYNKMKKINYLNDIDYKTNPEGRLLFAALAIMTTELYPNNTPDEVVNIINKRADAFLPSEEQNVQVSDTTKVK